MSEELVNKLLMKYEEGLSLYSIYIKLRFILSISQIEKTLKNKSLFINHNNKYISRELENISAKLSFYISYYKTKDIIVLHSLAFSVLDSKQLTITELHDNFDFLHIPEGIIKVKYIPDEVIEYITNTNTIIYPAEFSEFVINIIPSLKKYGSVNIDNSFNVLDIKNETIIPTFYIDYNQYSSWLYLYPKFYVGDELIDYKEVSNVKVASFIRKKTSWRKVGYGYWEKFNNIITTLGLIADRPLLNPKTTDKKEDTIINNFEIAKSYKLENFKFTIVEELEHNKNLKFVYSENAKNFINKLTDFFSIADVKLPEKIEQSLKKEKISLRKYQKIGINWLNYLRSSNLHGLIADDMGLGKTIQVIVTLACAYENGEYKYNGKEVYKPSLVICPKSVVGVWKEQLNKYYPNIRIGVVMGKNHIDEYLKSVTATNKIILLTSYETVAYRKNSFLNYNYLYLILDEAQKIKNHQTQVSKTVKEINAAHRIAVTGTPIENHLFELWSIFDFIMRGYLGTHENFKAKYHKPIMNGNNSAIKLLKKKIEPFKIRRTKKQKDHKTGKNIIELPELITDNIKISISKEQATLYRLILNSKETKEIKMRLEKGERVSKLSLNIFAILTRLKQICCHPLLLPDEFLSKIKNCNKIKSEKFEFFKEKISEIIGSEQKAVVFSQYKKMLNIIEDYLIKNSIAYSKLVGGMSSDMRERNINNFQNDKNYTYPIFLASLKAGGVGISLTSASNVIHYDRWWNPAVENQATDRVYRSGNDSTIVNVYKLISSNTIEEKIDKIMKRKQILLDNLIKEDAVSLNKSFTKEEILTLLSDYE